jgi:hypothetical protein
MRGSNSDRHTEPRGHVVADGGFDKNVSTDFILDEEEVVGLWHSQHYDAVEMFLVVIVDHAARLMSLSAGSEGR